MEEMRKAQKGSQKCQDQKEGAVGHFAVHYKFFLKQKTLLDKLLFSKSIHRRGNISQLKTGGYKLVQMLRGELSNRHLQFSHTHIPMEMATAVEILA